MGVYIPSMEMLKCDECFWCIGHRIKCPAGSKDVLLGGLHPNCPLIPVPAPHGRLGDLDALCEKVTPSELVYGEIIYAEDIIDAPTIIPKEEGET